MANNIFDKLIEWIDRKPTKAALLFLIILSVIFFGVPILLTQFSLFFSFDASTGVIGDTIGGITGPLIALIAAILTFMAFWIQFKANQQQRNDIHRERFESKFFELIRLHKENVNEISIDGYGTPVPVPLSISLTWRVDSSPRNLEIISKTTSGRAYFISVVEELKAIHEICRLSDILHDIPNKEIYLLKLAFHFLYYGIDSTSTFSIDKGFEEEEDFINICRRNLHEARIIHRRNAGQLPFNFPQSNIEIRMNFDYLPFTGQFSRLDHYFRQLFLIVEYATNSKYIQSDANNFPSGIDSKDYVNMLQAQLSVHEQAILYFNYIGGDGKEWENETNKYFSEYKIIKNLTKTITDFTVSPHTIFDTQIKELKKKGDYMFLESTISEVV
jgi:hypothetical protein